MKSLRMDSEAHGFAVIIDGVLSIRTTADTKEGAAMNALWCLGYRFMHHCGDDDCIFYQNILAELPIKCSVVPVRLTVFESFQVH